MPLPTDVQVVVRNEDGEYTSPNKWFISEQPDESTQQTGGPQSAQGVESFSVDNKSTLSLDAQGGEKGTTSSQSLLSGQPLILSKNENPAVLNNMKCFKLRLNRTKNRIYPLENLEALMIHKPIQHESPMSAFSYVNFNELEALIDLAIRVPSVLQVLDPNNKNLLHHAASKGHLKIAKFLVSNGVAINEADDQGNLPIHLAIIENRTTMTQYLLKNGSEALVANRDSLQPIHIACEMNQIDTLKVLLRIDDLDVNSEGERGATPLHYCCARDSVDCLQLLLKNGAEIYMRDLERTYPIHVAISNISHECAKALFDHEERYHNHKIRKQSLISPDISTMSQRASSLYSDLSDVSHSQTSIEQSHLSVGIHKRRVSKTRTKLLHLAQSLRRLSKQSLLTESCLIELTDCEGETPLHTAVTSGNTDMVKICLEKNAEILAKQNDENTPVHYACVKDDLECLQLLFDAKPNLKPIVMRMANKNGFTPLHLAAVYNHEKLIKYLIEQGSPLEITDGNGWTPLLLAAMKGAFQACIQLLRFGANPNAHDLRNRNLVHLLMLFQGPGIRTVLPEVDDENLFQKLVNEKDNVGSTPLHYSTKMGNLGATSAFLLRGASALEKDNKRDTPLHTAAYFGRVHTCEKLLATAHGMRAMNSPDVRGRLPLHVAVENSHVDVVKLFLEKGCVFRKCHLGNTPLHYVAIGGCIKTCRILLQTNPSLLNQTNFHGMTALHYAAKENKFQVLEHLLTSGALIIPDKDETYFVTNALQRRNYEAMRVVITHPRWSEIHDLLDNTPQCPIDGFIREMPTMCSLVLDRCIKTTSSKNSVDHEAIYHFHVLQRPAAPNEPPPKDPMRRMKLMVELQRKELLLHPLCTAYLKRKWQAYGRWIQLCATAYYALLLIAITTLVLGHSPIRHVETLDKLEVCSDLFYETPTKLYIFSAVAVVVVVLTLVDLVAKIWQLFSQKLQYFKDWNNYFECLLSILALIYASLVLIGHLDHHHVGLGVIVMFMAWFNFLLQMMRFNHVGIFVVMFLHVFATVGKCLVVFSVVFIAFALSFHVLFRIPKYKEFLDMSEEERIESTFCFSSFSQYDQLTNASSTDLAIPIELQSFQYLGLSLFKTLMMMLGEYEHTATLIEPITGNSPLSAHYPIITLVFYVAFVFLVPIILMNLLIGLAVGDIEHVRRSAIQRLISQQVYWLADLEPKLMAISRSKIYYANWRRKFKGHAMNALVQERGSELQETSDKLPLQHKFTEALQQVHMMKENLKLQATRTGAIIEKLDIKTKEYTMDEGTYPGILLGSGNMMNEMSSTS